MKVHVSLRLALGIILTVQAQAQDLQFERLTVKDGLASNWILAITQDHQGYLWIGTHDGLNRYDGYSFTTFTHNPDDTTSLAGSYVESLLVDQAGTLWVGTFFGGLDRFDPATETFTHFLPDREDRSANTPIHALCADREGMIWLGTGGDGLYRFDPTTEIFTHYGRHPETRHSVGSHLVRAIYEDRHGVLWVGTGSPWTPGSEGGLRRYHRDSDTFTRYLPAPDRSGTAIDNHIMSISEDLAGRLWVTTPNNGLYQFDPSTETFTPFPYALAAPARSPGSGDENTFYVTFIHEERTQPGMYWVGALGGGLHRFDANDPYGQGLRNPLRLEANTVWTFFEDRGGTIWIGTWDGLNKIGPTRRSFRQFAHDPEDPNSLGDNFVRAVYEDRSGALWVGTNDGLNRLDKDTGRFIQYRHQPRDTRSLSDDRITWITEDSSGLLWIGTENGLNQLDPRTGLVTRYQHHPDDTTSLSDNYVLSMVSGQAGTLWIGTWGGGLNRFDAATKTFTRYRHRPDDANSLSDDLIAYLLEDRAGTLWIGTLNGGLNKLVAGSAESDAHTVVRYPYGASHPQNLSHARVNVIHEDPSGHLWIGTDGGGLNKLVGTDAAEQFVRYTEKDGLPSDVIRGLLSDEEGHLWISTNKGLAQFNLQTEHITIYDETEGLRSETIGSGVFTKSNDGEMYVGGYQGFTAFFPGQIIENTHQPPLVFTSFQKLGRAVDGTAASVVPDELVLSHQENILAFEFAALDYAQPAKNRYAYRLAGSSDAWIDLGTRHDVTFMNLDPGAYELTVRGSNSRGVWNEEGTSIRLVINPPWWQTTWAYVLYGLMVMAGIFAADRFQRRRLLNKERARVAAQRTEEIRQQNARLRELDQMKTRFFNNISHEFRTPLTLTIGPLDDLYEGLYGSLNEEQEVQIESSLRSARRLLRLINQILDIARLEAGRMRLYAYEQDLSAFLGEIAESFAPLADRKAITLDVECPEDPLRVYFDPDAMEKVFGNLLSNAFKFTPEGGSIRVAVFEQDGRVVVTVADTGPGIAEADQEHLFERFYQTSKTDQRRLQPGTGIGLALVKELVELHGGKVGVESKQGAGAMFTVELLLGKDHLAPEQLAEAPEEPFEHNLTDVLERYAEG